MAQFETVQLTAPSAWASALINLDYSGLVDLDRKALNTWLAMRGLSFSDCLDAQDAGFMWVHDAHEFMPVGAECSTYTFKVG